MAATLTLENGELIVRTPYNAELVMSLKTAIPYAERQWDPKRKAWRVDPRHASRIAQLITQYLGEAVTLPLGVAQVQAKPEIRLLDVRYIGVTKSRPGNDERTAFGYADGGWTVIFSESVLREYFEVGDTFSGKTTLYGVLGVPRDATAEKLRTAFRRLAMQWHPDHNKEPDAAERFLEIKRAYDILSNPSQRARYDAGLALESTLKAKDKILETNYRAPLRCGYILAEGRQKLGRFVVAKILQWEDIVDNAGRVLVTSWTSGADHFSEQWVQR